MTGASSRFRSAGATLFGPLVWAAHFLVVYASESLFCRLLDGLAHTALLAAASVFALGAVVADFIAQRRHSRHEDVDGFIAYSRIVLDALSGFAILLVAAAGLALPACS